jgi:hypothetical protein
MNIQLGKYIIDLSKINYIDLGDVNKDSDVKCNQIHLHLDNKEDLFIDLNEIDVTLDQIMLAWGSL